MPTSSNNPVALITGAAKRIGAEIAKALHQKGFNVVIHYLNSATEAQALCDALNQDRADSAIAIAGNIVEVEECKTIAQLSIQKWQRLDLLVNNASSFYPTPIVEATEQQWEDLMGTNLKASFFLTKYLSDALAKNSGNIINIIDIHADRPLKAHPIYSVAKAGHAMLTKSLAKELAPNIRVNGVAPGNILWPTAENPILEDEKKSILERIPLRRQGDVSDITQAVIFLACHAPYITGQIIAVDGGRSLYS